MWTQMPKGSRTTAVVSSSAGRSAGATQTRQSLSKSPAHNTSTTAGRQNKEKGKQTFTNAIAHRALAALTACLFLSFFAVARYIINALLASARVQPLFLLRTTPAQPAEFCFVHVFLATSPKNAISLRSHTSGEGSCSGRSSQTSLSLDARTKSIPPPPQQARG